MKINTMLNLLSSVYYIGNNITKNAISNITQVIEDNIIKGKYVTREEFEILQEQYSILKSELPKNNEFKYKVND